MKISWSLWLWLESLDPEPPWLATPLCAMLVFFSVGLGGGDVGRRCLGSLVVRALD